MNLGGSDIVVLANKNVPVVSRALESVTYVPMCQRSSMGTPPQLSSPGSPGLGIVRVRHSFKAAVSRPALSREPRGKYVAICFFAARDSPAAALC